MSKNMASTSERYEAASAKFENAYNKYLGEAGLKLADNYATKAAERMTSSAANKAGNAAISSARTAGLNKAQAAMVGNKATSDAASNTYNTAYENSRNAALTNNANTINAATSQLNSAQTEAQNEYNRAWGNTKGSYGAASGFIGTLLSDERLKTFRDVSAKLDAKAKAAKADTNYALLKVYYKTK